MTKIKEICSVKEINLAIDTIDRQKQALVFVNTKRGAEKTAEEIAKKVKLTKELSELSEKITKVLSKPTRQCERLARCVRKGIAFHHAGLAQKQKEIIENSFRDGSIKIIACTPTLAAGVDLPAFRTIIRDLKRYGHRGYQFIPVLEYHQMAGRAGRPKFDKFGEAICLADTEPQKEEIVEKYLFGDPEEIYSKLAVEPVLRTYLLSLIASKLVNNKKSIMDFFEKTFWAHQFQDMHRLETIIEKMLRLLEEWEFIKSNRSGDFVSASDLKDGRINATLLGKRVAELYIDPLTAHHILKCLRRSTAKRIRDFSLLQMVSHTLEMRPLLRTKVKEYEEVEEKITEYEYCILDLEPSIYEPDYEDYVNSIKTASFMLEWIEEKDEEYLLETYSIRPGEVRVKLAIADWLLYASEELARIVEFKQILKEISKVRLRMKHGVKEELMPLLRLRQIGRVRGRTLFRNGYKTIADVRKADLTALSQLIGKNVAVKVKEQLGEKIEKVKPRKRKGQKSVEDYE